MLLTIIIFLVVSVLLFYASQSISAGVYVRSLCRNGDQKESVALTFDDGADPVMTPKVLSVLKKHGAKATFFIIGEKAASHPEIVRMIHDQGHSIGNHSQWHKGSFPMQSSSKIYDEITACSNILEQITGKKTKLFRPPFGVTNPMIARALKRTGLTSIGWSIRSFDTMGHSIERVRKRVSRQIAPGKVILLHDNRPEADLLLEQILQEIDSRGLRTMTVDDFFNLK